jgi:peptidoglycan hydrolase-like protein with peptidoglycan-binding domain
MYPNNARAWTKVIFTFLVTAMLALSVTALTSMARTGSDVKKVQQTLRDKGYDPGQIDGRMGPKTRDAIGQYQQAENLPVTQHVDARTAEKLGVEREQESSSVGGSFKQAGYQVGGGGKQFGHEISEGKPVAAGKDLGKSIGRGGKDVGQGTVNAVSPESDRDDHGKSNQ